MIHTRMHRVSQSSIKANRGRQEQKRNDFDQQLRNGDCKIQLERLGCEQRPREEAIMSAAPPGPRLLVSARAQHQVLVRKSGLPTCTVSEGIMHPCLSGSSRSTILGADRLQWPETEAPSLVN